MFKSYSIKFIFALSILIGCNSTKKSSDKIDKPYLESETIRIANDEIEYEIIIIDVGFQSWFNSFARPRKYYSQSYLEARNSIWVLEYNRRAMQPTFYNPNLYMQTIDYQNNIDYGYEVNYMLFNYLTYFQLSNNIQLGSFTPRI